MIVFEHYSVMVQLAELQQKSMQSLNMCASFHHQSGLSAKHTHWHVSRGGGGGLKTTFANLNNSPLQNSHMQ